MIINSTNINNINNRLSLILILWTQKKKTMTYDVGNPGPGLGQMSVPNLI